MITTTVLISVKRTPKIETNTKQFVRQNKSRTIATKQRQQQRKGKQYTSN